MLQRWLSTTAPSSTSTTARHWSRWFLGPQQRSLRWDDGWAMVSWACLGSGVFFLVGTTTCTSLIVTGLNALHLDQLLLPPLLDAFFLQTGIRLTCETRWEPQWRNGRIRISNVRLQRKTELLPEEWQQPNLTHFDVWIDRLEVSLDALRWLSGFGPVRECWIQGVRGVLDRRHLDFRGVDPLTWLEPRQPTPHDLDWKRTVVEDVELTVLDYNGFRPYSVQIHYAVLPRFRLQWLLYDVLNAERIVGEYDGAMFSLVKPNSSPVTSTQLEGGYLPPRLPFTLPEDKNNSRIAERMAKLRMTGINMDMLSTGAKGPLGWIERGTVDVDAYVVLPQSRHQDEEETEDQVLEAEDERMLANVMGELDEIKEKLFQELVQPIRQKMMEDLQRRKEALERRQPPQELEEAQQESMPEGSVGGVEEQGLPKEPEEILSEKYLPPPADSATTVAPPKPKKAERIRFYVDVRLHNIRASIKEEELQDSGIPATLVRPVVAYLNAQPSAPRGRKTAAPPISAAFSLPLGQFNGAWTLYQCGLMDAMGTAVTNALARMVVIRYVEYQRRGRKKQQQDTPPVESRWLPWIHATEKQQEESEEDEEEEHVDAGFEEMELLEQSGPGRPGEARGLQLISRVAWWTLQQAVHSAAVGGKPPSDEEERMIEVYNEMVWGL